MQSLISSSDFHFILRQARDVMNGHMNVKDEAVLDAVGSMAEERSRARLDLVPGRAAEVLRTIRDIRVMDDYERFREALMRYVRPMSAVSDRDAGQLFPKVKNLRMPKFSEEVRKELTYLGWNDPGTNRKYLIFEEGTDLVGLFGQFRTSGQKGVCSVCNGIDEVGLFLAEIRYRGGENYSKRGNYICNDSMACNRRLDDRSRFDGFIGNITK